VSKHLQSRDYGKLLCAQEEYHRVGKRPLPGRGKSRRLRPGISKYPGSRGKTLARQCGTHTDIFLGFFVGQSPFRGSEHSGTQGGQRLQKKAQKRRGGGHMDYGKPYEDIRGKNREGKGGGGLIEGQLVISPTTFFWPSRSTCWLKLRQPPVRQEPN